VELRKIVKNSLLLAGLVFLASTTPINAQYYGGGDDTAQLILDKKLRSFPGSEFRDNIDKTVKVFYEDNLVEFSVLIKNSGNVCLNDIRVTDQLPANLSLIFHPGEFDDQDNKLVWQIDSLAVGEEKTYLIRAKVNDTNTVELNSQRCNKAEAWVGDISDSDTACYFIGGMEVPGTGNAGLWVQTILVVLVGSGGWVLRKYARGY